jgi:hypothetical protein
VIAVAIVAVIGVAWWRLRTASQSALPASARALQAQPLASLIDGLKTAESARDWGRAVENAGELVRRSPRNSTYLLILAQELNNFAWTGAAYARDRTAMRSSLARVGVFTYSFALLDSATALTRDAGELAMIRRTRGQLYELVGLPIDALAIYQDVLRRVPGDPATASRNAWVTNHLRDPLTSDAEWLRRAAAGAGAR